jgi:hypothetical protein
LAKDSDSGSNANQSIDLAQHAFAERRHSRRETPGRVAFDELGNAKYQWKDDALLADGAEGDTRRQRALSVSALGLVDDEPPPDVKTVTANKVGLRLGYNPYDSGRLEKQQYKKSRDLRALSKWIESQRKRPEFDSEE